MKTNRLNTFVVVGTRSKSTPTLANRYVEAVNFSSTGKAVHPALQTKYGNALISSKS